MNRIAEHREAAGFTQQQLAVLVGTDVGTISRYERGQDPRLSRAGQIARVLRVRIDDLYFHAPEADTASTADGTDHENTEAAAALPSQRTPAAAR